MNNIFELLELLLSYGIDFVIVISILAITQGLKMYFKCKKDIAFLILIILGLIVGITKFLMGQVEESLYLTVILGYSGITSLIYIAIDIFLPAIKEKFFPSSKNINEK